MQTLGPQISRNLTREGAVASLWAAGVGGSPGGHGLFQTKRQIRLGRAAGRGCSKRCLFRANCEGRLEKCNMLCLKIANPLHIDTCGLLVHFERLQNSCKEKVPKTRLCANCIRKSRKSEDFRPFFGRGDRI